MPMWSAGSTQSASRLLQNFYQSIRPADSLPSQCLMLVSEQLSSLQRWAHSKYMANLAPFSLSLFPSSILLSPIKHIPSLFPPLTVWLSDTYNRRCDRCYSFYTNSLYLPAKDFCWEVSNGRVSPSLSSPCLLCADMCAPCSCSLGGCMSQWCLLKDTERESSIVKPFI